MADSDLSEGVTYEDLGGPVIDKFMSHQTSFSCGFVRLQPYNQVLPKCFLPFEKKFKDWAVYEDDVWISSFPKCGTTWTEEMVWCIMNDLNFAEAKTTKLDDRIPFLEFNAITDEHNREYFPDYAKMAEEMKSPRMIKTHLSFEMLPNQIMEKKAKLIYVTRNPRDACVSFYNHWRVLEGYTGTFEDFAEAFLNDVCGYYTPFLSHVRAYWGKKDEPNILFITYEEMKKDLVAVIRKTAAFLGKSIKEEDIPRLTDHLSFNKMKNNAAVNKSDMVQMCNTANAKSYDATAFMRKGQTGNWTKHFSPELSDKFEKWEEEGLKGTDFKFVYNL